MDLENQEQIRQKHIHHWAMELEPGDTCKATIRHKTDGTENRTNVMLYVITNFYNESRIRAWDKETNKAFNIDYNELTPIKTNEK